MKTITLKNEDGEIIEVKREASGEIRVRHSGKDKETFGEFREMEKVIKEPGMVELLAEKGIDKNHPLYAEAVGKLEGFAYLNLKIGDEGVLLSKEDAELIREAIKQLD